MNVRQLFELAGKTAIFTGGSRGLGLRSPRDSPRRAHPWRSRAGSGSGWTRPRRSCRLRARHNINVNAVAPGYFPTRMTDYLVKTVAERMTALSPFNRPDREGELKGVVVFLASEAASFITGQVLNVDGGATIW